MGVLSKLFSPTRDHWAGRRHVHFKRLALGSRSHPDDERINGAISRGGEKRDLILLQHTRKIVGVRSGTDYPASGKDHIVSLNFVVRGPLVSLRKRKGDQGGIQDWVRRESLGLQEVTWEGKKEKAEGYVERTVLDNQKAITNWDGTQYKRGCWKERSDRLGGGNGRAERKPPIDLGVGLGGKKWSAVREKPP